jgi:HEAT repeat protein
LQSEDRAERQQALRVLGERGAPSPEVLGALRAAAGKGDLLALWTYHVLAPADPFPSDFLVREIGALRDPSSLPELLGAFQWLRGHAAELVSLCRELLRQPTEFARYWAVNTLRNLEVGPEVGAAVADLADCLRDPSERIREEAAMALARLGPSAAPALGNLIVAATDSSPAVRNGAYTALGALGPSARAALPVLVQQLLNEGNESRFLVAGAIEKIGLEDDRFSPQLNEAMETGDETVITYLERAIASLRRKK